MRIHDIILATKKAEEKIASLQRLIGIYKQEIQQHFDKESLKEFQVYDAENKKMLVAIKTERVYIDYFVDKLKEKLDKETFSEVVEKEYELVDVNKLKSLLKKAGVSLAEFKQCVFVKQTVKKDTLQQLFSVGEVSLRDLDGCYNAKIVKNIVVKEYDKD